MSLSRRDFVKICTGTVAGFGVSQMFHPAVQEVFAQTLSGERPPVFWIQGSACTGCTVSFVNNVHPGVADVLLKVISLEYHPTIMGGEGAPVFDRMMEMAGKRKGEYILMVEGAVPVAHNGHCCVIAETATHEEITMTKATKTLAADAAAVLALGTCAAYGGIPAAKGSETGCMGVIPYLKSVGVNTPVINVPGCPPHPDWMVGTALLAMQALKNGTTEDFFKNQLDVHGRPKAFYQNVHMNCPYLPDFEAGKMCKDMNDKDGCRYTLGCKGPRAACDSPKRKWNNHVNWCVANATCIGCTTHNFPDGKSPFYSN